MILSTHAIFGAAVASLVPNHPVAGFALGFASHFALDAIPHRDYDFIFFEGDYGSEIKPINILINKFRLIRDMLLVSFDAFIGLLLAFLLFFDPVHPAIFLLGVIGALIPDFLVILYIIIRHKSLKFFHDFHTSVIHSKVILKLNQPTGVLLQFCTLTVLIAIMYSIKHIYFLIY